MKTDICQKKLYIREFFRVMQSSHKPHKKFLHTAGRARDGLVWVKQGGCKYGIDGKELTASAGQILYLPHGSIYSMEISPEGYEVLFVDFLFGDTSLKKADVFTLSLPEEAEQLFYKIYRRYLAKDASSFCDCMSLLYRIYGKLVAERNATYLPPEAKNKLERARDHLLQNLSHPELSVSELSAIAGVSEVYLRRLFHEGYGCSPGRYLINARLRCATELMGESDMTLEQIALQCGFASLSYFCRVFKEEYGLSPGEYRKALPSDLQNGETPKN